MVLLVYMVPVNLVIRPRIVRVCVLRVGRVHCALEKLMSVTRAHARTMLCVTTSSMIFIVIVLVYQVNLEVNFVMNK